MTAPGRAYWDRISARYQVETHISCTDIHYGPMIPGDRQFGLMPVPTPGMRCLELGCGAGQNSICLARRGACCVAVDISVEQLQAGRTLAHRHQVDVMFVQADLRQLPFRADPGFDLVHSAYALPFLDDQRACIREAAACLRPGGTFVFSTAHPVSTGEWLTLDDEYGVFLPNYFDPPRDRRTCGKGARAECRPKPLSTVFSWLSEAGLAIDRMLEPSPVATGDGSKPEITEKVPYWSEAWIECREQVARIPFVVIFRALKPEKPVP